MHETLFLSVRIVLAAAVAGDLAHRVWYRCRRRVESGPKVQGGRRPFDLIDGLTIAAGAFYYAAASLFVVFPRAIAWGQLSVTHVAAIIGMVVLVGGLALLHFSHRALGSGFRISRESTGRRALVTNGPYAHLRHPLYLGHILLTVGAALATSNLILGTAAVFIACVLVRRTRTEDAFLEAAYGEEWRRYASRVRAFRPGLR